jgi:acyl-coenzyme A synthetase/AMP-(fatty) acid ligase
VLADNGAAWVIADLACQDAGVVHLPLPDFFNAAQLRHALEQAGADTVLTDRPERIDELDMGFGFAGRWQAWRGCGARSIRRILPPGTAKISFTSGSTGAPKGVCLGAAGLLDTARALRDRLADLPLARVTSRCCRWPCCWRTWPASMRPCCAACPCTCRRWPRSAGGAWRASTRRASMRRGARAAGRAA